MSFLDDCKRLASSWQQDKTGGKPRVETPPAGPPDLTGRFATGGMMSGSLLPRIDIHASADDTFEQVKEAAAEPNAQVRVKIDDRDWQWLRGDVFLAFLEQREKPEGEGQILVDQVRYPKDMEGNAGMCFQIFDPPVDSDREACESGASENTKEEVGVGSETYHRHVWRPLIRNADGGPSIDRCQCNAHRVTRDGGISVLNLVPEGQTAPYNGIVDAQRREIERLRDRGRLIEQHAETLVRELGGVDPAWWVRAGDALRALQELTGNEQGAPKEPPE